MWANRLSHNGVLERVAGAARPGNPVVFRLLAFAAQIASSEFAPLHQFNKIPEVMFRIVWAGSGFRMVLH